MIGRATAALLIVMAAAPPARSTAAQETFARPRLSGRADTNDWEAYYREGVELLRQRATRNANAALYWASRLDPRRPEPHFARWVAFWFNSPGRYLEYLGGNPRVVESRGVREAEAFLKQALYRNPLTYQGLEHLIFSGGRAVAWGNDAFTQAFVAYAVGDFPLAARQFEAARLKDPAARTGIRYQRALAFAAYQQYDSATAELQMLLSELRQRETEQLVRVYESKALLEYALGMLEQARGRHAAADAAFRRALVEDLGFYPAQARMGDAALRQGSAAAAVQSYAQAVEIGPPDPVLRQGYGQALLRAGRLEDAEASFRAAIEMEPFFADPYYGLAQALEQQNKTDRAIEAYRAYLLRAPHNAADRGRAQQGLAALTGAQTGP